MMSQPGQQTIAIHIFPNISRNKGNQAMKFVHLIQYNMRNIFVENHTQKVIRKLFPNPHLKYQN